MFKSKLKKEGYQSELDAFFHQFDDKRNEFPQSRLNEIQKHRVLFNKRDNPVEEETSKLWSGF